MTDIYRPQFHFTAPSGWINDPNGLIYRQGEYHLFYQYLWPKCWGHAVSRDLVRWDHLPVALEPDTLGDIWSGSVAADEHDTSGFFGGGSGLVAVFTHHHENPDLQSQSLAYSADNGRSWTKYAGNPVLTSDHPDFRDPKVFRHAETGQWVMVLAAGDSLKFFLSPDLKAWQASGEVAFGDGRICECPDLFALPVDGDPSRQKWILHWSEIGRGMHFMAGEFDGRKFVPDEGQSGERLSSGGKDDYAAITWADAPGGRGLFMGWMNQWDYADRTPDAAEGWQGAMTLPRELSLRTLDGELRLCQSPAPELKALRGKSQVWNDLPVSPGENPLAALSAEQFEIVAEIEPGAAAEFGFRLRRQGGQQTTVGYDAVGGFLFLDRRQSGLTDFHPDFPLRHEAALSAPEGAVRLHLFVDRCSVEVFGGAGEVYFADLIFPNPGSDGMELYAVGGAITVRRLEFFLLK